MPCPSRLIALLGAGLIAAACRTASPAPTGPDCLLVEEGWGPAGTAKVRAETVVSGLEVPWGIAFLPDGDWLVTERPGRVRRVSGGALIEAPVASVPVSAEGEGGLLGIALHPDFAQNRGFFLYLTGAGSDGTVNRVERWQLSEDKASASRVGGVLDGIPGARFHDGGRLRVGPDGMLYVATGDAQSPDAAREADSLAGKLLRVTPEGGIPQDNPTPGSPVFLSGIRNSQGFDWLADGRLVVADHGPSGELGRRGHDEVSVARAGDDLGWPTIFGCERREGLVTPAISWRTAAPPGGLARYTGDEIPEWSGSLLVGTLGSRHLQRVVLDAEGRVTRHEVYFQGEPPGGLGRIREVIQGPDGGLLVTTSNCDGRGSCPEEKDGIVRIRGE